MYDFFQSAFDGGFVNVCGHKERVSDSCEVILDVNTWDIDNNHLKLQTMTPNGNWRTVAKRSFKDYKYFAVKRHGQYTKRIQWPKDMPGSTKELYSQSLMNCIKDGAFYEDVLPDLSYVECGCYPCEEDGYTWENKPSDLELEYGLLKAKGQMVTAEFEIELENGEEFDPALIRYAAGVLADEDKVIGKGFNETELRLADAIIYDGKWYNAVNVIQEKTDYEALDSNTMILSYFNEYGSRTKKGDW